MTNPDDTPPLFDLSPLEAEPAHFEAWASRVMLAADDVLARRRAAHNAAQAVPGDAFSILAGWRRPLLAAAAVVVLILIPVEVALERREASVERIERIVQLSGGHLAGERMPTGAELMRSVSGVPLP